MVSTKFPLKKLVTILIAAILVLIISVSVNATSIYNVNGDTDNNGKEIIDIRDLVRAKKLSADNSGAYDADFFIKLRRILLGIDKLPIEENTSGSIGDEAIYLPVVL